MKNSLLFDFTVDKSTSTVHVNREFNASQSLVWDAFTKPEILDLWWAPKPWAAKTKLMNFEVDGRRFYAMVSPEGDEHWSLQKYTSITPSSNFKYVDSFVDKDEIINAGFPSSSWDLTFSESNGISRVDIVIKHTSLEALEQHIAMGFQGGFTMTLNYLDQLLESLKSE